MNRSGLLLLTLLLGCVAAPSAAFAQAIERGQLKSLDLEKMTIVITARGQDRTLQLSPETRVLNASGETLAQKLKDFKPGVDLFFQPRRRDGGEVAMGLKLVEPGERDGRDAVRGERGGRVSPDHSKFKPLPELATEKYGDSMGGLYPSGKNERPTEHEAAGLELAKRVRPLNAAGEPSADGVIVLLSIGMSNTSQASRGFRRVLEEFPDRNRRVVFIDGAQGGMTAATIDDDNDGGRGEDYWREVDRRLEGNRVTRQQVQAIWIKQADAAPRDGFPAYAKRLESELASIVQIIARRFPNARLCYLSSRTYGGYATSSLNPEPYAYESGFSVKWLIERQLKGELALNFDPKRGEVTSPWLSWGPYLWANGATPRSDGFAYEPTDFAADGTHHSEAGSLKVGRLMLDFFRNDTTTRNWFLR